MTQLLYSTPARCALTAVSMGRATVRILTVVWALVGVGCATIVTGTKDEVEIVTVPSGATVEIQGQIVQTPATVTLSRSLFIPTSGQAHLAGYRTTRFEVPRDFNLWTIGNIATLGVGAFVDVLSGAFLTYPDRHEVLLQPRE